MSQQIVLKELKKSVEKMETKLAKKAAQKAIDMGIPPAIAIREGLEKGMKTVSDLFDEGELFIPHLLVAADIFETAANILTASMSEEDKNKTKLGKILIYTVKGDIHDIGKNIVKIMLSSNGFEVIDLGRDVDTREVLSTAKQYKVDIIAGSTLMTTTMSAQQEIINLLRREGIRDKFKCMFGGGPVSQEWVKKIGADAYIESASEAVQKAKVLIKELRG